MSFDFSASLSRRFVLGLAVSGAGLLVCEGRVNATALPQMVVHRDPTCGCCHKWVEHLVANGFPVTVNDVPGMRAVKAKLGVPPDLASCHTAEIDGYVVEGHVPASAIKRLISDKPQARGLAVPGMPVGSPGMEGGEPETYDVILFNADTRQTFGRYREDKAV